MHNYIKTDSGFDADFPEERVVVTEKSGAEVLLHATRADGQALWLTVMRITEVGIVARASDPMRNSERVYFSFQEFGVIGMQLRSYSELHAYFTFDNALNKDKLRSATRSH